MVKKMLYHLLFRRTPYIQRHIFLMLLFVAGCGGDNNQVTDQLQVLQGLPSVDRSGPNEYLQLVNQQRGLPAGRYTLLLRMAAANNMSVRVELTGSSPTVMQRSNCQLPSGSFVVGSNDNCYPIMVSRPGGLSASLATSPTNNYSFYFFDEHGRMRATAENNRLLLQRSLIDYELHARAYYQTIDPSNTRTTLEDWKKVNGFDEGHDAHIIFRDARDLGYGRNMFMRQNPGTSSGNESLSVFVGNYLVRTETQGAISPAEYGNALSLEAAIMDDRRYLVGTNAIEFSKAPDGTRFAQFYTFDPAGNRLLVVDLDGRGAKSMPGPCIVCHNGLTQPLVRSTATNAISGFIYRNNGDTKALLQPLEVVDLIFSENISAYTKTAQEAMIKRMNIMLYCTYPGTNDKQICMREHNGRMVNYGQPRANDGYWQGDLLRELVEGWYGGVNFPSAYYREDFIPSGWRHDPLDNDPPLIAEEIFREVVGPNCHVCHAGRGSSWPGEAEGRRFNPVVDLSNYQDFISYGEQLQSYIFDLGIMPLSGLNYNRLFGDPRKLELLAAAIPNFTRRGATGNILLPGRPISDPGPDRHAASPVTLNGIGSQFAKQYQWTVRSMPTNATAGDVALRNADSVLASLETSIPGEYTIELRVGNGNADQDSIASHRITVDNSLPSTVNFTSHIRSILDPKFNNPSADDSNACVTCHQQKTPGNQIAYANIPVWFSEQQPDNKGTIYQATVEWVNFQYPRWSKILIKPSTENHGGGIRSGFNLRVGDRANYDLMVNWIMQGAPQ